VISPTPTVITAQNVQENAIVHRSDVSSARLHNGNRSASHPPSQGATTATYTNPRTQSVINAQSHLRQNTGAGSFSIKLTMIFFGPTNKKVDFVFHDVARSYLGHYLFTGVTDSFVRLDITPWWRGHTSFPLDER